MTAHRVDVIIEANTGTLAGTIEAEEEIVMGVDEDAWAFFLASVSEKLYEVPERAVTRELFQNARDSHQRAGQTRPVLIKAPTALNPTLIIQDFGVGLGIDQIRSLFSKFYGSDKRASNAERGGIGLGSKSPLALASQYTFVAIQDGVKRTVLVSRGPDGIPVMRVLSTEKTDEHNGVTMVVPVPDADKVNEHIFGDLFATTPRDAVLIDGRPPAGPNVHDTSQYTRIGDFGWLARRDAPVVREHMMTLDVMGVHYPVPSAVRSAITSRFKPAHVVLALDNGSVEFSTSRDSITPTERSISAIRARLAEFEKAALAQFHTAVRQAESAAEALLIARDGPRSRTGSEVFEPKWRGLEVPLANIESGHRLYRLGSDRADSGEVECVVQGGRYVHVADGNVERALRAGRELRAVATEDRPWRDVYFGYRPHAELEVWVQAALAEMTDLHEQAKAVRAAKPKGERASSTAAAAASKMVTVITANGQPTTSRYPRETVLATGSRFCYLTPNTHEGIAGLIHSVIIGRGHRGTQANALVRALTEAGWTILRLRSNEKPENIAEGLVPINEAVDELLNSAMDDTTSIEPLLRARRNNAWKHALMVLKENEVTPEMLEDPAMRQAFELHLEEPQSVDMLDAVMSYAPQTTQPNQTSIRLAELADTLKTPPREYVFPLLNTVQRYSRPGAEHLAWYLNALYREHAAVAG